MSSSLSELVRAEVSEPGEVESLQLVKNPGVAPSRHISRAPQTKLEGSNVGSELNMKRQSKSQLELSPSYIRKYGSASSDLTPRTIHAPGCEVNDNGNKCETDDAIYPVGGDDWGTDYEGFDKVYIGPQRKTLRMVLRTSISADNLRVITEPE